MTSVTLGLELEIVHCAECSTPFGPTEDFIDRRRRDGRTFWCPNGHKNHYKGESDAAKIKRLADEAAASRARTDQVRAERDAVRRQLTATKGVVTRTRKRIANGVCPCCDRSFTNLHRHMTTKHPDYVSEEIPA